MSSARRYVKDLSALLAQVVRLDLPVPISLAYRDTSDGGVVEVQVREQDWHAWLPTLRSPELGAVPYEGTTHLHAQGLMRQAGVTVHLITVSQVGELPEVGVQ